MHLGYFIPYFIELLCALECSICSMQCIEMSKVSSVIQLMFSYDLLVYIVLRFLQLFDHFVRILVFSIELKIVLRMFCTPNVLIPGLVPY
jgi:hypothetical protein